MTTYIKSCVIIVFVREVVKQNGLMHNEEVNSFFRSIIAILIFFHVRVPLRAQKFKKLSELNTFV